MKIKDVEEERAPLDDETFLDLFLFFLFLEHQKKMKKPKKIVAKRAVSLFVVAGEFVVGDSWNRPIAGRPRNHTIPLLARERVFVVERFLSWPPSGRD